LTTRTVLYNLINQGKPQVLYSILWAKRGGWLWREGRKCGVKTKVDIAAELPYFCW
jgi:hypothetical protein